MKKQKKKKISNTPQAIMECENRRRKMTIEQIEAYWERFFADALYETEY